MNFQIVKVQSKRLPAPPSSFFFFSSLSPAKVFLEYAVPWGK